MADPVEGIVFDMDGVLVDSEPLWLEAELACFGRVGLALDAEQCAETRGMRCDEVVRHWFDKRSWAGPSVDEVVAELVGMMDVALRSRGVPLRGAVEVPRGARDLGYRVGLATSAPHVLIEAVVEALGLHGVFETVHSAADHPRGKPHPAVYEAAVVALGLRPEACVAVEDSVNGLIAARAAGMVAVAVPEPAQRGDPRMSIAHHQLAHLDELLPLLEALSRGR